MPQKRTVVEGLFMAITILAGALGSAALARWILGGDAGFRLLPLILGAVWGGVGWLLAENIGDAAFLLLITGLVGAVVLAYLPSETLRVAVIAFLCGFNVGKVGGSIYREYR